MVKILFLSTGGTIASTPSKKGFTATLSGEEILKYCSLTGKNVDINIENIFKTSSTHIQPEDWVIMAQTIANNINDFDGIVVTHGTSTMAYTASMLSFMLGHINKPVILTGSMKTIGEDNTDAIINIKDSIIAASSGIQGVFVVINRLLYRGVRASKTKSAQEDAFVSVNAPILGEFIGDKIKFNSKVNKIDSNTQLDTVYDNSIVVIKLFPGMDPKLIQIIINAGYKGIVIESYGTGGIPYKGRDLLREVASIANEIPVLITTQVTFDGVNLPEYEAGRKTLNAGVISAHDMSKEAAITKFMWVLGHTKDVEKVKDMMYRDYTGEIDVNFHCRPKLGFNL